jgi:hypothetical protein
MNTNTDGVSAMSAELDQPEKQTDWYAGMTEKHYDIAVSRAVAAERERWIAACNTVAEGAEAAGRPGVQTVAQIRQLALDGLA